MTEQEVRAVPMPDDPDHIDMARLCATLGRTESTVYRYIEQGLPSYRWLGKRVFRWSEVREWIASRPDPLAP